MYSAAVENKGGSKYFASMRNYSFVIGTEGEGANPVDTLLASLCGCIGHRARDYMVQQRIACDGFVVKAETDTRKDDVRLSHIRVVISLKDTKLGASHLSGLLQYVEGCKVYGSLKANSDISMLISCPEQDG